MHLQGLELSEVGLVGFPLLPAELSLHGPELIVLRVVIACEVARRIRLHLVVVPGEGAEAVGIVSLVEYLHGRAADYGIHVSGPMVEVALLFPAFAENGRYGYRILILEESEDGLDCSVAHAELLGEEGDLNRAFPPVHSDPVLDDGETFVRSRLSHFPERHSAAFPGSDVHEAMVVLRLVVVSDYGWVFLSHITHIRSFSESNKLTRFPSSSLYFLVFSSLSLDKHQLESFVFL